MNALASKRWENLDEATRRQLDREYLRDLGDWNTTGLTEEGLRVYLDYRHERAGDQITTYEEGQIRRLLHEHAGPPRGPDPVEQEEHTDWIERFGARRLHLTNARTYVAVMMALTFAFLIALMIVVAR